MARDFTKGMKLKSFEEIVSKNNDSAKTDIKTLRIDKLHSFKEHPFKVLDDEDMEDLVESIKECGVLEPIMVREDKDGFEIISGHRRTHASKLAGLTEIPAIIKNLKEYDAVLQMTAANKYRSKILPSEKAFSYAMELQALKRKREAEGLNSKERTDKVLADSVGESRATIQRYIRLTHLAKEWLDEVDKETISINLAQPLSHIATSVQREIYDSWIGYERPKINQELIEEFYNTYKENDGNYSQADIDKALGVLKEFKPTPRKLTFKEDTISKYFDDSYSVDDMQNIIVELLEEWAKKGDKQ